MNPIFIAVIEDGNVIQMNFIEELEDYSTACYFFKKEISSSQTSMFPPKRTYHSYYYTPIDNLGKKKSIKIGNLRLTEIGPDKINYHTFFNRPIKFYDEKEKTIREIISKDKTINFLYKDVKLNIDILKKVKDWKLFLKIKDYDNLKNENEKLKEEKSQLEKKINTLENK